MKRIYLHEFNVVMGNTVYIPNVSGMLQAFAETQTRIVKNYIFMPFVFLRKEINKMVGEYENPEVLAFSSSMWNHEFNLALAKVAKEKFPRCTVVFGGPHIPQRNSILLEKFLRQNKFIDLVVIGEGEETFSDILVTLLETKKFSNVKGISFIHPDIDEFTQTERRPLLMDINSLPSPYLNGTYNDFLKNTDFNYQVILETNRGCPFGCAFCFWGNGPLGRKMRFFDLDRVKKEVEWLAKNKIQYVFGADSNFGMLKRDLEITSMLIEIKKQFSYPQTFRVCYGKNAEENIFTIAQLLDKHQLCKGVTLSFQSTNPSTLEAIKRKNISLSVYQKLQQRYHKANVPVYTELILGLPNETYGSFVNGIEESLESGLHDQLAIFFCEVLPNTDMADPEYAAKYGIITKKIELAEPHASKRGSLIQEYEDIVISTNSMPLDKWKKAATICWIAQTLHGLKLGFFVSMYLFDKFSIKYTDVFESIIKYSKNCRMTPIINREILFYKGIINSILKGKSQCVFLDEFGDIAWQIEEASFLRFSEYIAQFYREFEYIVCKMLSDQQINFDNKELSEVFLYQKSRIITHYQPQIKTVKFTMNIPEYFNNLLNDKSSMIQKNDQVMTIDDSINFNGNKKEFAKQMAWFGRRDGRMVRSVKWKNIK